MRTRARLPHLPCRPARFDGEMAPARALAALGCALLALLAAPAARALVTCPGLSFPLSPTTSPADGSSQPWYGACDYARSVSLSGMYIFTPADPSDNVTITWLGAKPSASSADPTTYTLPAGELRSRELARPSSKRARCASPIQNGRCARHIARRPAANCGP